jgi:type IV pilus assembly protein PilM
MRNLAATYPIGLDFSDQDVYAVQLKKIRDGTAVRAMVHQRLSRTPADFLESSDTFVSSLKDIVKNNIFRGKRALIHIPSQYVFTFPISFEIRDDRSIEEAMVRELEAHLSFPVKDAVIDYPSLDTISSGATTKYKAVIIAAERDKMEHYLHVLERAGLSVEAVDFGLCSLMRLHRYLYNLSEDPVILCNIGHTQSILAIVTHDSILAYRNVSWGIQTLLNRLQSNLELPADTEPAMALLRKYGISYEDFQSGPAIPAAEDDGMNGNKIDIYRTLFQILIPHIDDFIHELHPIIGYVRSENQQAAFEGIYMYGHANSICHLDRYLEKTLNIPTRCINPTSKLIPSADSLLSDSSEGAPFALALGLAMRRVPWL